MKLPLGTQQWKRLAAVGLVAMGLLATVGCSSAAKPGSVGPDAANGGKPKMGGTLVQGFESDIGPMDIEFSHGAVTNRVNSMVYDALVQRDYVVDHDVAPQISALADKWTMSPDGLSLTFNLHKGVSFTDGTPWNAAAAKFDIDRNIDPAHPFYDKTAAAAQRANIGKIKDVEVVDDSTLKVNMKSLEVNIFDLMEGYRFPSPASIQKWGATNYPDHPVGTGPFTFDKYESGVEAVLSRNPNWWDKDRWGGGPFVDKVDVRFIPEASTRVAALMAGEVDWIAAVPPDSVATIKSDPKLYVALDPAAPHVWIWRMNFKNELAAKKPIRQAMALAIDRDRMVHDLLKDTAVPAYQFWPPGSIGYRPVPKDMTYGYDPERAKKLLADAGYPNGIDILAYVPNSGSGMMIPGPMNEFIQENMAKVGIRVKFQTVEWQTYLSRSQAGFPPEYAVFNSSLSGGNMVTLYRYFHSSQQPPNGGDPNWYVNPKVDQLLDAAAAELDPVKRTDLYDQVNDVITEDVSYINVVHDKVPLAWNKSVQGFQKVHSWSYSLVSTWLNN